MSKDRPDLLPKYALVAVFEQSLHQSAELFRKCSSSSHYQRFHLLPWDAAKKDIRLKGWCSSWWFPAYQFIRGILASGKNASSKSHEHGSERDDPRRPDRTCVPCEWPWFPSQQRYHCNWENRVSNQQGKQQLRAPYPWPAFFILRW